MARIRAVAPGTSGQEQLWPDVSEPDVSGTGPPRSPVLTDWPPAGNAVAPGWVAAVAAWQSGTEGQRLSAFLNGRLAAGAVVYPPAPLRALQSGAPDQVRVVIVGQDPYHGPGQAEGYAFSVAPGVRVPPSLRNIFKELVREGEVAAAPAQGSLQAWTRRGVLLLNTCLTVEDSRPGSHAGQGWEALTDAVLTAVARQSPVCVFLLWGAHAQAKAPAIEAASRESGHTALILRANHPSPLSAARPPVPFVGCGHFRQAREWLADRGQKLDWCL